MSLSVLVIVSHSVLVEVTSVLDVVEHKVTTPVVVEHVVSVEVTSVLLVVEQHIVTLVVVEQMVSVEMTSVRVVVSQAVEVKENVDVSQNEVDSVDDISIVSHEVVDAVEE